MTRATRSFPPSEAQSGNPAVHSSVLFAVGFPLTRFALAGMTARMR